MCSTVGRVVLVILNILFVLISLALIAAGVILKFVPDVIMNFLSAGIGGLIPDQYRTSQVPIPDTITEMPMFDSIGIALLVAGVILFVIAFLACCGACYKWRPLLIGFIILTIVVIVIFGALGGLLLVKDSILHQNIRDSLSDKTEEERHNSNSAFSMIMNLMSVKLKCCGITGPETYATDWKTNLVVLPFSCCKKIDAACMATRTVNDIKDTGCYSKLTDLLDHNKTWAIIALCVLEGLMLLEVIFAICIVVDASKDKVGPV